jgi:membrane-associated phospholipid phosphatase
VRRTLLLFLPFLGIACASARMAGRDVVAVAKGPGFKRAAVAAAATGAALLLDDEIAGVARRNDSSALDRVETFGGGGADKVIAGFLLYGVAKNDARARATAFDALVSSVIASKAITPALKALTDRERPNHDGQSFPSNHATNAFALASAISAHYPRVRWLAYGIATGVGAARIANDAHWTSDVVAGAAIGTFVGHTVAKTNQRERATWTVAPVRNGLLVSVSW